MAFQRFQRASLSRIFIYCLTETLHVCYFHQNDSKHGILWERFSLHSTESQSWREVIFNLILLAYFIYFL